MKIILPLAILAVVLVLLVEWKTAGRFFGKNRDISTFPSPSVVVPMKQQISSGEFEKRFNLDIYIPSDANTLENHVQTFANDRIVATRVFETSISATELLTKYQDYFKAHPEWKSTTFNSQSSNVLIEANKNSGSISIIIGQSKTSASSRVEITYITRK